MSLLLHILESGNDNYFGAYKVGSTIIIPKVSAATKVLQHTLLVLFYFYFIIICNWPVHDIYFVVLSCPKAEELLEFWIGGWIRGALNWVELQEGSGRQKVKAPISIFRSNFLRRSWGKFEFYIDKKWSTIIYNWIPWRSFFLSIHPPSTFHDLLKERFLFLRVTSLFLFTL